MLESADGLKISSEFEHLDVPKITLEIVSTNLVSEKLSSDKAPGLLRSQNK